MKRNLETYQTVSILGSFNKHYEFIKEDINNFTTKGFDVLAPAVSNIKSNNNGYVLFESDKSDNPVQIEQSFLDLCKRSDVIYICNVGGYLGKTVMFELGYLLGIGKEIFFKEYPSDEPLLQSLLKQNSDVIVTSKELAEMMLSHNEVFKMREWPDQYLPRGKMLSL